MSTRITDSPFYQHLWGTAEARDVLGEEGRLRGWLEVIVALARAQAAIGVIPTDAARLIAEHARPDRLDLDYAAEQTRQTSHSMLGLIRALQEVLPEPRRASTSTPAPPSRTSPTPGPPWPCGGSAASCGGTCGGSRSGCWSSP